MIDYIVGGEFLNVSSNKGAMPYVNMSNTQPMVGMLGYDASSHNMKVYDGSSWQTLGGGSANVQLTGQAISILKWAEKKMQEEKELIALAEQNPTIKNLVDQMNSSVAEYQHKIAMVKNLIKEEEKVEAS